MEKLGNASNVFEGTLTSPPQRSELHPSSCMFFVLEANTVRLFLLVLEMESPRPKCSANIAHPPGSNALMRCSRITFVYFYLNFTIDALSVHPRPVRTDAYQSCAKLRRSPVEVRQQDLVMQWRIFSHTTSSEGKPIYGRTKKPRLLNLN